MFGNSKLQKVKKVASFEKLVEMVLNGSNQMDLAKEYQIYGWELRKLIEKAGDAKASQVGFLPKR